MFYTVAGDKVDGRVEADGAADPGDGDLRPAAKFLRSGMRSFLQRPLQQNDEGHEVRQNEAKLLRQRQGESENPCFVNPTVQLKPCVFGVKCFSRN